MGAGWIRSSGVALTLALGLAATAETARAQTTPQSPSAAQPTLPQRKPGSPVVEGIANRPPLEVRKRARHLAYHPAHRHHHYVDSRAPLDLERPALAGVELLAPLPRPGEPPHIAVPLPAYPLDSLVTAYTTPPPPVVCHRVRREPDLPDPRLYREIPVACEPDNP